MKFLADENFPLPSVRILSTARHGIVAVVLESPGVADETVLERAVREARVLLTFDRDYGSLLYQRGLPAPGGIVYWVDAPALTRTLVRAAGSDGALTLVGSAVHGIEVGGEGVTLRLKNGDAVHAEPGT